MDLEGRPVDDPENDSDDVWCFHCGEYIGRAYDHQALCDTCHEAACKREGPSPVAPLLRVYRILKGVREALRAR